MTTRSRTTAELDDAVSLDTEGRRNGNAREAVERYTGDRYTQHSTGARADVEGFVGCFEPFVERNPDRDDPHRSGVGDHRLPPWCSTRTTRAHDHVPASRRSTTSDRRSAPLLDAHLVLASCRHVVARRRIHRAARMERPEPRRVLLGHGRSGRRRDARSRSVRLEVRSNRRHRGTSRGGGRLPGRPGATVVGIVRTPFGWAGLGSGERPHDRNERVTAACDVPVVSAVSGVLDWLDDLEVRRVALAATYDDRDWCDRWERFVAGRGVEITNCSSTADLGIVDGPLAAADETHWTPTMDDIERMVTGVLRLARAEGSS